MKTYLRSLRLLQGLAFVPVIMALDAAQPLNTAFNTSLRLDMTGASGNTPAGISNEGYWEFPSGRIPLIAPVSMPRRQRVFPAH
jgi:hypothetical protein